MHRLAVAQLKTNERTFVILTATPTRKKIRVVQHDEYGVYRDEDGNAQIVDGRIIKVSKEDIKAILEMADKSGKHYLSLLRRDEVMEMMWKVMKDQDKLFEDFYHKINAIHYPLNNIIAWISKTMEELQQKLEYTEWII
ncbi:hypothetical protein Bca4012_092697 [Brassica carinata]